MTTEEEVANVALLANIITVALWATGLAVLRHRAAGALAVVCIIGTLVIAYQDDQIPDEALLRTAAWLVLAVPALLKWGLSSSPQERWVGKTVSLCSGSLAFWSMFDPLFGGPIIAILGGIATWLLVSAAFSMVGRSKGREKLPSAYEVALEAAHDSLRRMSPKQVDEIAEKIVLFLDSTARPTPIIGIAREIGAPWGQVWVLCALLSSLGKIWMSGHSDVSVSVACSLTDSKRAAVNIYLGDHISERGTKIVANGDTYNTTGANVTGAFGHNKVRDISSTATGGQHVTPITVAEAARSLAETLPADQAEQVRTSANELEVASDPSSARRALIQLAGIAATVGPSGESLLELARHLLERLGS